MKEATGELNMTVVIVIAVAILAAFFYTVIWPLISDNFNRNSKCSEAICACANNAKTCEMATCYVVDENGNKIGNDFQCPWKG